MPRSVRSWALDLVATPAVGPRPRDAALVLPFVVLASVEGLVRSELALPVLTTSMTVAMIAGLLWRRRHPLLVLVWVTLLGAVLGSVHAARSGESVGMVAMVALLAVPFSLFRHGTVRMRQVGGLVLAIGLSTTLLRHDAEIADALVGVAVVAAAALSGALVRERVAARARALDMARSREREAVARDLHDTVAHHVTTIAVRAQVASAMPEDRAQVAESLAVIEREAQEVLAEMRTLVRSLRQPTAPGSEGRGTALAPELAPAPGLEQLARLADPGPPQVTVRVLGLGRADGADPGRGARATATPTASTGADGGAGAERRPATDSEPTAPGSLGAELPQIVSTTLFRIAQEGVTNARRHARGARTIDVTVSVHGERIVLEVRDDAPTGMSARRSGSAGAAGRTGKDGGPVGGHGLLGMRERAGLLGGTLEAGPAPEGGWLLRAELPIAPARHRR